MSASFSNRFVQRLSGRLNLINLPASSVKRDAILDLVKSSLSSKLSTRLDSQTFNTESLKTNILLSDLSSMLQSTISSNTAQRRAHLSRLSASLQQSLDSIRDALTNLRSEIQTTSNTSALTTRKQRMEGELQRREGSLGIAVGEFRTRAEGVKLRAIYTFTMGIAMVFLAIVVEKSRKKKPSAVINGSGTNNKDMI